MLMFQVIWCNYAQISGTVTVVYTDDTKFVTEGQRLVEVDHADLLIALQRSSANLAQTVRQFELL